MVATQGPVTADLAEVRSAISEETWTADSLVAEMRDQTRRLRPFDQSILAFSEALSKELMAIREHPEAVSLGFWMRPASITRMRESLERQASAQLVLVPRGLAFHVTPANVDTMFVYSWIMSLLAGNTNIVRLSSRSSVTRTRILDAIRGVLHEPRFGSFLARERIVHTGHDDRISRALSAAADVRVLWGGDATIEHFRQFPIPTRSRDVVFADRHSFAILDESSVRALDERDLGALADRFFNDAYWFDQGACSSPRLILWRISGTDDPLPTLERFHAAVLAAIGRRGYQAETGMALNKMAFALDRAAREDGVAIDAPANETTWVRLPNLASYDQENCGGGLFFEFLSNDLERDLKAVVGLRDQTAACFGIKAEEAQALAMSLNGQGVDRFVSMGQALEFGSIWDGLDLLQEFSKRVVVDVKR